MDSGVDFDIMFEKVRSPMNLVNVILAFGLAYLFGSIPFALVIGKVFYKTDIRTAGSGNLGGTNAGRVLGRKAGIAVSLLDLLKAFIVILVVNSFAPDLAAYAGVIAAIGHSYPIFANFKGGKAVSTAAGYLMGVSFLIVFKPLELFVVPAIIFFGTLKLTKYVSLSSMLSAVASTLIALLVSDNFSVIVSLALISALIIYRHRANIQRLINKTESKVTWI
jgi:glycerol-3-phosphate acyltransferase PlsY